MAKAPAQPGAKTSRFSGSIGIGLALTAAIMLLTQLGVLGFLERPLLDLNHRWFARFTPPPSPRIIHIDIDDNSLARTGRWPWPRSYLGRVVDELDRAGAAVIGFDLLLDEHQEAEYQPVGKNENGEVKTRRVDHDARFAAAMRRAENVILPVNITFVPDDRPLIHKAMKQLRVKPAMTLAELRQVLSLDGPQARQLELILSSLKARAIHERLLEPAINNPQLTDDQRRERVFGSQMPGRVEEKLYAFELNRVQAIMHIAEDLPFNEQGRLYGPLDHRAQITVPIEQLAACSQGTGFVSYEADADGVVRSVPLWLEYDGKIYPHFALALACRYLDVPIKDLRIEDNATVIPDAAFPDGAKRTIRLPMVQPRPGDAWRIRTNRMLVAWQTNAENWVRLFSREGQDSAQHFPIGPLVEIAKLKSEIEKHAFAADAVLLALLANPTLAEAFDAELVEQYDGVVTKIDKQPESVSPLLLNARDQLRKQFLDRVQALRAALSRDTGDEGQALVDQLDQALAQHRNALDEAEAYRTAIDVARAKIKGLCDEAICLVGWTATGSLADFVPTSLDAKCPGVVVHGAVLNAILTDHFLRRAPWWADLLAVAVVGLIATLVAARYPPVSALLVVAGLIATYFLINGMTLFDYGNVVVHTAGPTLAAASAWMGVTVWRLLTEQRQRMRITRQFKNYVSPDLVDFLVDNPQLIKMEGQSLELTCMFTDIAGFTTISQNLGPEQTAKLLNRYLAIATEQLMKHKATVNKYLGDGIMAFWGAPVSNERHAVDACLSVLSCIEALRQLEDDPMLKDMPKLFLRVGLATGTMMVGDFGAPPQRSDYTVIGDSVNLAARLESANKQFGTQVLMNGRTHELVRDRILARPIGKIIVVGRDVPEPVWQMLNTHEAATEAQRHLAEATTQAIQAYYRGQFDQCEELFDELIERFGASKLIDKYLVACTLWKSGKVEGEFDGSITLSEK